MGNVSTRGEGVGGPDLVDFPLKVLKLAHQQNGNLLEG